MRCDEPIEGSCIQTAEVREQNCHGIRGEKMGWEGVRLLLPDEEEEDAKMILHLFFSL
jgi:hypothetical protein